MRKSTKGILRSQKSIKAVELRMEHPDWTLQRIGDEVGVTRGAVRQALERKNVATAGIHKSKYEHNCPVCGVLVNKGSYTKGGAKAQVYCSWICFIKDHRVTVTCVECGMQFSIVKGQVKRHKLHFCSRRCLGRYAGTHYGFVQTHDRIVIPRKYNYEQIAELINKGMCYREVDQAIGISEKTFYYIRQVLKLSKLINV